MLSNRIANLQKEIKTLENQGGESNGNSAQGPAGPSNAQNDDSPDQTSSAPNNSSATETNGREKASYDVFYDRLQADGRWFSDEMYGYVWQPNTASADQNWRPYMDGRGSTPTVVGPGFLTKILAGPLIIMADGQG